MNSRKNIINPRTLSIYCAIPLVLLLVVQISLNIMIIKADSEQELTTESWEQTYGGSAFEQAVALLQLADGGYALLGETASYGEGSYDIWLLKIDSKGKMLWNHTFGGIDSERATAFIQTVDGGFAILGDTKSYTIWQEEWDDAGFIRNLQDIWLVKTDPTGIIEWNHSYGGPDVDTAADLVQTADGGFVLVGWSDFYNAWLIKTDGNGIIEWNCTYGYYEDVPSTLLQTINGDFILAGTTRSYGYYDMWLVKTNSKGVVGWNYSYGGPGIDNAAALIQIPDGGFALAGRLIHEDNSDMWLVRIDSNGRMLWNQTYGGSFHDEAHALIQTSDGGFALAGEFYEKGNSDMWLVKTDQNGKRLWSSTYGGTETEWAAALLQTNDGGFILLGTKHVPPSNRASDIWLVKIPPYTPPFPTHVIFGVFLLGGVGFLGLVIIYYQKRKNNSP